MLKMIPSNEISVVIQGPLYRDHAEGDLAKRAIASIRKHLPAAEIVLSTWRHQNTNDLIADQILLLDEPPSFFDINGKPNNISRQIVSTHRGIQAASRPYVLKFRADLALLGPAIAVIDQSPLPKNINRYFISPITITNLFVRNPLTFPTLFHLSDLVQFGHKQDLLHLWSVPLPQEKDVYQTKRRRLFGQFIGFTSMRMVPEQYLMIEWLKKHGHCIHLPDVCYTNYPLFHLWERIFVDNFLLIDWQQSEISFPKRLQDAIYSASSIYTENDIDKAKRALKGNFYRLRYIKLLINQYVTCWFNRRYLLCFVSNLLFLCKPQFAQGLRNFYKKWRGAWRN